MWISGFFKERWNISAPRKNSHRENRVPVLAYHKAECIVWQCIFLVETSSTIHCKVCQPVLKFCGTNNYDSFCWNNKNSGPCDGMVGMTKNVTFAVAKSEFYGVH